MSGAVVDLQTRRVRANGHLANGHVPAPPPPVHEWNATGVVHWCIDKGEVPHCVVVRWSVFIDPRDRHWEAVIHREGWQHVTTLHGKAGSSFVTVMNELLSASFGVMP